MKNRLIINLILAVFIIALGLIAWLKPGQEEINDSNITGLNVEAIHSIKIKQEHADTIELKRIKNQWELSQPINARALSGKIERLLKISQIKPFVTYPLENASLGQFGLETPVVTLTFNNKTLKIGHTESVQARRYVSNETQLFLLDDTFLHHLTAPVNAYIDTRLLPDGIQIIGLKTPQINLQRQQDNTWQNTQSPTQVLSSDAVQMLLDEWRFARAIDVSTQFAKTSSDQVIISLSNQQKLKFNLIKQKEDVLLISIDKKLAYRFSDTKYKKMTTLPTLDNPDA